MAVAISYASIQKMNKRELSAFIVRNRKYVKGKKKYKVTGKSRKELLNIIDEMWGKITP